MIELHRHLAAGIVLLLADALTVMATGSITAAARDSTHLVAASGGNVFIRGGTIALGDGRVTAEGGFARQKTAGIENRGSVGYIVVDATSVSGTTLPPVTTPFAPTTTHQTVRPARRVPSIRRDTRSTRVPAGRSVHLRRVTSPDTARDG